MPCGDICMPCGDINIDDGDIHMPWCDTHMPCDDTHMPSDNIHMSCGDTHKPWFNIHALTDIVVLSVCLLEIASWWVVIQILCFIRWLTITTSVPCGVSISQIFCS